MRILQVIPKLGYGGAETGCYDLAHFLAEKNCKSIFIPPGFIHGFLGLDKENLVIYGCTNYRDKNSEIGVNWNDKDLNINWNIKSPIISKKDKKNIKFKDVRF